MKKLHALGLAISAALCIPLAAHATDGRITFNGALSAQTCTISPAGGSFAVTLPTITAASLAGSPYGGATNFSIDVSACPTGINSYVAYFEAGANVDMTNAKLKNTDTGTGAATFVEIDLTNADGSPIDLRKPTTLQGVTPAPVTGGKGSAHFFARYFDAGGPVVGGPSTVPTAGSVHSYVDYSLVYN